MFTKEQAIKAQEDRDELVKAQETLKEFETMDRNKMTRSQKIQHTKDVKYWLSFILVINKELKDAPPQPMNPKDALNQILRGFWRNINSYVSYVKVLEKFQGEVAENPSYAISWAGRIVEADWLRKMSSGIIRAIGRFEGTDLERWVFTVKILLHTIKRETEVQLNWDANHSSGMFSNAVEQAQASARNHALRSGTLDIGREITYLNKLVDVWTLLQEEN